MPGCAGGRPWRQGGGPGRGRRARQLRREPAGRGEAGRRQRRRVLHRLQFRRCVGVSAGCAASIVVSPRLDVSLRLGLIGGRS